jgi:hypothetical protein
MWLSDQRDLMLQLLVYLRHLMLLELVSPLVFNRISYPLNYCQSNFAHEFAKRDVQKESHKAKCTHQKDCPMPDGASHVPASSGIRRNDSRQVVPTGAQGVRRQGRAIRN